ncbi:MAG: hypothetical protein GY814_14660 [Gammaproteobacteria bacterium]|nr:hypothetical protein [Gammaproteobacteria bacterium]
MNIFNEKKEKRFLKKNVLKADTIDRHGHRLSTSIRTYLARAADKYARKYDQFSLNLVAVTK